MADSAVGFSFQADVVNVGSLTHLITGRALKALSDGGVDFYAVLAVHVLGKNFVVKSSMEVEVRSHIMALGRIGIQSVLAKALKIGWGHSGLAEDMTRTRAGTNALLLVGALATGSTYFHAAQCLSKLLSLHGCEADKLPNVDVLRHMIGYLSPFVRDLGFPKVLGYITAAAMGKIRAEGSGFENEDAEQHLTDLGDASGLAGAINQLMLTSKQRETIYMVTRMRGAWLSTFASHILGMAVELRLNGKVIWACGGDGTAIFELGQHHAEGSQVQALSHRKMILIQPSGPTQRKPVAVSYPIGNAFECLMIQFPMINIELRNAIRRAICRLSKGVVEGNSPKCFDVHGALRETLTLFGFEPTLIDSSGVYIPDSLNINIQALDCMQDTLVKACGEHQGNVPWEVIVNDSIKLHCLCAGIGRLISGFAVAATTLTQCHFNPTELMLSADLLSASMSSTDQVKDPRQIKRNLIAIMSLTSDDDNNKLFKASLAQLESSDALGLSGGSHTVYCTCIMQNDCYDIQGRIFSISPGRASVDGILRPVLLEKKIPRVHDLTYYGDSTLLSPGLILEPHYIPSDTHISMDVRLTEDTIVIWFSVGFNEFHPMAFSIAESIRAMEMCHTNRCNHGSSARFEIEKGYNLNVIGFHPLGLPDGGPNDNAVYLFALHGNKLAQLATLFFLLKRYQEGIRWACQFQLQACLKCCIDSALRSIDAPKVVVMGN